MMNGATPSGSGSMPSTSAVIVALPAIADLVDVRRVDLALLADLRRRAAARVSQAAVCSRPSASGSIIVALIRVITSPPNGCCLLSIEATATGVPVARSSSVATTVVVPRSKAMAYRCSVVSPGSTSMSASSTTTAVTLKSACAQHRGQPAQHVQVGASARGRRSRRAAGRGRSLVVEGRLGRARRTASGRRAAGSPAGRRRRSRPWAGWSAGVRRPSRSRVALDQAGQPPAGVELVAAERCGRRAG